MEENLAEIIVGSIRQDGKTFRPSDWAERISAAQLANYGRNTGCIIQTLCTYA